MQDDCHPFPFKNCDQEYGKTLAPSQECMEPGDQEV